MQHASANAVFDKVALAVEQTLYIEPDTLTPDSRLVADLRLGKFGRVRLTLHLEETFEIELSDEAVDRFDTVGDIVHYMSRWWHEDVDGSGDAISPVRH
jgi:acyl carrier protein